MDQRAPGAAGLRRALAATQAGRLRLLRPADPAARVAQALRAPTGSTRSATTISGVPGQATARAPACRKYSPRVSRISVLRVLGERELDAPLGRPRPGSADGPARYSARDCLAFIEDLYPLFRDRRYVRVDGRPLLLVYKIANIPDVAGVVARWRDCAGERHRAVPCGGSTPRGETIPPPSASTPPSIPADRTLGREHYCAHARRSTCIPGPCVLITGVSRRTFSRCHDPLFASSRRHADVGQHRAPSAHGY